MCYYDIAGGNVAIDRQPVLLCCPNKVYCGCFPDIRCSGQWTSAGSLFPLYRYSTDRCTFCQMVCYYCCYIGPRHYLWMESVASVLLVAMTTDSHFVGAVVAAKFYFFSGVQSVIIGTFRHILSYHMIIGICPSHKNS